VTENPREVLDVAKEARAAILATIKKEGMQKYLLHLRMPSQRPLKTEKAKNVLRGLLAGIYTSKKHFIEGLEGPEKLTENLLQRMQELGIVTMTVDGVIQYHEVNIDKLSTDPRFLDQLLAEEHEISVPQPTQAAQTSTSKPADEDTFCSLALQVCEDLAQRRRMQLTVGTLLESVYWRVNCAGGEMDQQWISRVLEFALSFGAFSIPPNIPYSDFLAYPEKYREYQLI
jgi:hypothetical protein